MAVQLLTSPIVYRIHGLWHLLDASRTALKASIQAATQAASQVDRPNTFRVARFPSYRRLLAVYTLPPLRLYFPFTQICLSRLIHIRPGMDCDDTRRQIHRGLFHHKWYRTPFHSSPVLQLQLWSILHFVGQARGQPPETQPRIRHFGG
jgi:hypothetical protein